MFRLALLGPVLLQRQGAAIALPIRKTQALLLLLARGGAAPRARLVALLWPGLDESAARRNLRRELARLRDAGAAEALVAEGDFIALSAAVEIDARAFERALDAGQPEQALALWRGDPADGLRLDDAPAFNDWLALETTRLRALRRRALEAAAAAHDAAGDVDAALAHLDTLLDDDPLQELHHRAAMRLLAAAGRRDAALVRYERCRTLLQAELGLAPMAETEALATALRGQAAPPALSAAPAAPRALLPERLPFVGRETEAAWLEAAWRRGVTLLVEGEGGVGKSRLAIDFAAAHGPHAVARCRAGDADMPLASFTRALRLLAGPAPALADLPEWVRGELARLLPELGPPPPPVRTAAERARFTQACAAAWQAWAAGSFDAVVVDDWHLADAASRALLAQMEAGGREPVRLVLVYRPPLAPAAAALLQQQREAGAAHLRLEPLGLPALFELVQRLSGAARPERFAALLLRATGGHPFYVAETLRHLVETGVLTAGADGVWHTPFDGATQDYRELPLPASVRDAVLARVQRLADPALRVLEAAALADEPFAAHLLAPACALSEVEAALALEAAHDARLLREHEGGGYGFAHDLVQQALESALGGERRRSVHRRLALGAAAAGAAPARVAAHHEAGGEPARAVVWRQRAAEAAWRLLALDEAIAHWKQALADGAEGEAGMAIRAALLRALDLRGSQDEAAAQAVELLREADGSTGTPAQRAGARVEVAAYHARRSRAAPALALLDALPAELPATTAVAAARARAEALRVLGRVDESRALQRATLEQPGLDDRARAELLDSLLISEFYAGHLREALDCAEQSLALAQATNDGIGIARALGRRGSMQAELGEHAAAEASLHEAADLCARIGMAAQQRSAHFNLCALYSSQSRPADVLRSAHAAWAVPPPIGLEPLRTQLRLAFVEAHAALGGLGEGWRWALGAIDDARALGQLSGAVAVLTTACELLSVLAEGRRLAPLMALLGPGAVAQLGANATELWLIHAEAALMDGDLATARAHWQVASAGHAIEKGRLQARWHMVDAAMQRAEGDPAGALARLPADDLPGVNDELRWRVLAVRLQAEAALGGCAVATLQAAEQALQRAGVHELAALQLHHALVRGAPSPARRAAWQARVDRLAATLATEPALMAAFVARWRDPG